MLPERLRKQQQSALVRKSAEEIIFNWRSGQVSPLVRSLAKAGLERGNWWN